MKVVLSGFGGRHKCGFSLIELVVVILIVAIITASASPRLFDFAGQSRESATARTVDTIRAAIDLYVADHSAYPETIDPAWFASQKLTNPFDPNHAIRFSSLVTRHTLFLASKRSSPVQRFGTTRIMELFRHVYLPRIATPKPLTYSIVLTIQISPR